MAARVYLLSSERRIEKCSHSILLCLCSNDPAHCQLMNLVYNPSVTLTDERVCKEGGSVEQEEILIKIEWSFLNISETDCKWGCLYLYTQNQRDCIKT